MRASDQRVRCPVCEGDEVEAVTARASVCLPFPPVESLRCLRCGNTGTRLCLRERTVVQWARGG